MKRTLFVSALALAGLLAAGCSEEEQAEAQAPADAGAPKKAEIPPYEPTGDHADVMKEAAKDITADNALAQAKALEAKLDGLLKDDGAKEVASTEGE